MRCIVKDCKNHDHEGKFVGSLCFPCHEYITKAEGRHSQAYRNTHRTWVGLTDEERSELVTLHHGWNEYGQAIEAKLKDKNS